MCSCLLLVSKTIGDYYKKTNETSLHKPINQNANSVYYGATDTLTSGSNDNSWDDTSSLDTVIPAELSLTRNPWSAYNWIRLLISGLQLGSIVYMTLSLDKSDIDLVVEGRYSDLAWMYYARIAFWV